MLRELLALFKSEPHDRRIAEELDRMIRESAEIVRLAGDIYFQRTEDGPTADGIKQRDKVINKLQRLLRREAFGEVLGDPNNLSLPFCLSVMNIVKDVERLGDYAKDLAKLAETAGPAEPSHEAAQFVEQAEGFLSLLSAAMRDSDPLAAVRLIEHGKGIRRELAALQQNLLTQRPPAPRAAADTLALQCYIRIVSHGLNALSTLVTPLDRMDHLGKKDYLPEVRDQLDKQAEEQARTANDEL
jgi:phosphate transport system protein